MKQLFHTTVVCIVFFCNSVASHGNDKAHSDKSVSLSEEESELLYERIIKRSSPSEPLILNESNIKESPLYEGTRNKLLDGKNPNIQIKKDLWKATLVFEKCITNKSGETECFLLIGPNGGSMRLSYIFRSVVDKRVILINEVTTICHFYTYE